MRDSTRIKIKQKIARYNLDKGLQGRRHETTVYHTIMNEELFTIITTHLTAIWSQVLSSINMISGIICVKNIMKHDMIAEYLTTSNMRWQTDLCGPSLLFFTALLLAIDVESWSFIFFFRILPDVLDSDALSSALDDGKEDMILALFWLFMTLSVVLPSALKASVENGGGGGADAGGGATDPRNPVSDCSLFFVRRSPSIERRGVDSPDEARLRGN